MRPGLLKVGLVLVLLQGRGLLVFLDLAVAQRFGLIGESAEQVCRDGVKRFLDNLVAEEKVSVIFVKNVDKLNQALLFVVLEVRVLLWVAEVGDVLGAGLQLGEVNNGPLLVIGV